MARPRAEPAPCPGWPPCSSATPRAARSRTPRPAATRALRPADPSTPSRGWTHHSVAVSSDSAHQFRPSLQADVGGSTTRITREASRPRRSTPPAHPSRVGCHPRDGSLSWCPGLTPTGAAGAVALPRPGRDRGQRWVHRLAVGRPRVPAAPGLRGGALPTAAARPRSRRAPGARAPAPRGRTGAPAPPAPCERGGPSAARGRADPTGRTGWQVGVRSHPSATAPPVPRELAQRAAATPEPVPGGWREAPVEPRGERAHQEVSVSAPPRRRSPAR